MHKLIRLVPWILILLISFLSWSTLLSPGFFSMHDNQQIARLFEMYKALSGGQFPVRYVSWLGFGYGYPLFNFYPPFVYYLGSVFHFLSLSLVDSTKLVWAIALVGSALSMYALGRYLYGAIGGVVSAIFYLYAPYHAVDAFVRGAFAELFSFVWLPLILLFSLKSSKEGKIKYSIFSGIFLALLMVTHNLIFLPFFGLFLIWQVALIFIFSRNKLIQSGLGLALTTIIAFSLSAFFWLPALAEKQFTLVDQLLIKDLASYTIHFVCPSQLWNSLWGFGGSTNGCLDGLSFKIGKLHIILSLISLVFASLAMIKIRSKVAAVTVVALGLLAFSALMATNLSKPIWDNLPPLWYLQFPWRFLEFVALFSSLAIGFVFSSKTYRLILLPFAIAVCVGTIFLNAKYFAPQTKYLTITDKDLTSEKEIKWTISLTSFEYMPKGVATKPSPYGTVWVDVDQNSVSKTDYRLVSGKLAEANFKTTPGKYSLSGNFTNATVQLAASDFPGWQVQVDNRPVKLVPMGKYRQITFAVPNGMHKIEAVFTNTPVRTLGNSISLIALITLGLMGVKNYSQLAWKAKK